MDSTIDIEPNCTSAPEMDALLLVDMSKPPQYDARVPVFDFSRAIPEWVILPPQMSMHELYLGELPCTDQTKNMTPKHSTHGVSAIVHCSCREILSRRRGFVCMTGAKKCPHCGLRVPQRVMRDFSRRSTV